MDKRQMKKGFTVVEALVAILLFSVAVVAVLRVVGETSINRRFAERFVTAEYLTQNALEIVRNMRDTNFINGNDWLDGIDQCVSKGCTPSLTGPTPTLVPCDLDCPVYERQANGAWEIASNTSAGSSTADAEIRVRVEMTLVGTDEIRVTVEADTVDKGEKVSLVNKQMTLYKWYQGISAGDQLGECSVACGIEPRPGRTIVTFNTKLSQWTTGIQETGPVGVSLPAGSYDVFLQSYDSYPTRPSTPAQTNERWFVRMYEPGGYATGSPAAETSSTNDLVDGIETACLAEPVDRAFTVPAGILEITAAHQSMRGGNWESVVAVCAAFDKL